MAVESAVLNDLAPSGELVAALNLGNPVLVQTDPASREPRGVSVDLATELGRRLGVPVRFAPFDTAGKVTDGASTGAWNLAFLAIDPKRAEEIAFTSPYVIIEGAYLVPKDSPLRAIDDVDREGVRIAVGHKTAYDLYLTREIKRATLVRAPSSQAALDLFLADTLDVAAGVRQPLIRFAAERSDVRVMDGRFMTIQQALAVPKGRERGRDYLQSFIEEVKASGFVGAALERSGQGDAQVAPPGSG